MNDRDLLIVLGNQLFPINYIKNTRSKHIFMAEDYHLCTDLKHHKLKILFFFLAMREYRKNLIKNGFTVHYYKFTDKNFTKSYEDKLQNIIQINNITKVNYFEIIDKSFRSNIENFIFNKNLNYEKHNNPMFVNSINDFIEYSKKTNNLLMANYYKLIRKKYNILVDKDNKPIGGKWSFDSENRKKIPNKLVIPKIPINKKEKYYTKITANINKVFKNHPGNTKNIWFPTNRDEALKWLENFIITKLENFGPYEDAIISNNNFLFHSALSPLLNIGLITPDEVILKLLNYAKIKKIKINSLEGIIRQIIGWREFIKGTYEIYGEQQYNSNFWKHKNKLNSNWYTGSTGILPLDDTIKDCLNYGYTHHIPRLMIIANIMVLSRIHPKDIYKWFMEMFIDSSEWVMVPNVYGMGSFADGGVFSTKPYICGSNYILKMSNYKKDTWCDILDGLYWKFISDNKNFFKTNPRISIMINALNNIKDERKKRLFKLAQEFIKFNTK